MSDKKCLFERVQEQEMAARDFGFYWDELHQLLEQIHSECGEIQEAWDHHDKVHLEEEVGDLLQAAISLAVFCKLDPYEALRKATDKFQKRYDQVVALAHQDGHSNLHQQPFEVLLKYWKAAKKNCS